jgi:membrane protease subunit (stomatin/prohibitin family)
MESMSDETRARLVKASRMYARLQAQAEVARRELAEAIIAERKEGALIEDITAVVPYRQTQVNRILEAAGLTEKRKRAAADS